MCCGTTIAVYIGNICVYQQNINKFKLRCNAMADTVTVGRARYTVWWEISVRRLSWAVNEEGALSRGLTVFLIMYYNFIGQSSSWELNICSVNDEVPSILRKPNVRYSVHTLVVVTMNLKLRTINPVTCSIKCLELLTPVLCPLILPSLACASVRILSCPVN